MQAISRISLHEESHYIQLWVSIMQQQCLEFFSIRIKTA